MVDGHCFPERRKSVSENGEKRGAGEDFDAFVGRLKEQRKESEHERNVRAARMEFYRRLSRR